MDRRPHAQDLIGAAFDSSGSPAADRKLIIFAAPRTGSYELCRLLTAAGIGTPHEYFHTRYAREIASRWEFDGDPLDERRIEAYIGYLLERRVRNGVFSVKVQFAQYCNYLQNAPGSELLSDAALVHLYRPDTARQFSSLRAAQTSGRWDFDERIGTEPQADSEEAASRTLAKLLGEDAGFNGLFVLLEKEPLFVTTEELNQPREVVERIGKLVGVDPDLEAVEEAARASKPYKQDPKVRHQTEATIEKLRVRFLEHPREAVEALDINSSRRFRRELSEAKRERSAARKAVSTLNRQLSEAQKQIDCLERERSRLASLVADMRTSSSWRLTWPLRRIRGLFSRGDARGTKRPDG